MAAKLIPRLLELWRNRRSAVLAISGVAVLGASLGVARLARSAPSVPTAEVTQGEFVDWLQLRGEVKAQRSSVLTAPSGAGDIQIVELPRNGTPVKRGEIVVRFDTSQLQTTLDQKGSELKQADAEIEKARQDARLKEEQDQTDLLKARYDVDRAKLDVGKAEVISFIDAEKFNLALADAEQRLREAEQKLTSNRLAAAAEIESRRQKREKALFDVRQAESNIAAMTLRASVDGLATLMPNWRAGGGFGSAPEWRQGDRAWPGASIVELPDLSTLRVALRVEEADRSRLGPGLEARIRVDAVPDKDFTATVEMISPLAKPDFSNWPPVKNFDMTLLLKESDPRLRPGMSVTTRIAVERIPGSILVPAEAVFARSGRTVVYVLRGSAFEERPIEVARRSGGQIRIAGGVKPGERVALKDPLAQGAEAK
jgi:RND family efflux transporter MFP subunit